MGSLQKLKFRSPSRQNASFADALVDKLKGRRQATIGAKSLGDGVHRVADNIPDGRERISSGYQAVPRGMRSP